MPRLLLQVIVALGIAMTAGYYWSPSTSVEWDEDTMERRRALPQTYLDNPRTWSYSETGALTEIVEAQRMERYGQFEQSIITEPRFYSHNGNNRTWSVRAERGRLKEDTEILVLAENVRLHNDQSDAEITADKMGVDLRQKIAHANVPVTITQGGNVTTAGGMTADLDDEWISLKPNVESIYVQP